MSEYIIACNKETALWIANDVDSMKPIIRCRNCACWFNGYCGRHSYEAANEYGDTYTEGLFPMDGDDFCSLGERMEVGE